MRNLESGAYLLSGKRVTRSLKAANESCAALGSRSVGSCPAKTKQADLVIEIGQPFQVVGIVHMRIVRDTA